MKGYMCIAPYICFTKGKVYYKSKNGFLVDDLGDERATIMPESRVWAKYFKLYEEPGLEKK